MPLVVRPQHPASAQSGTSGYSGWSGTGFSGPPGPSGQSGYSGPAGGPSGVSGFSGYSGADGQGTSGTSGYSGADGQGTSGTSGYSGDSVSGVSGYSGASVVGLSGSSGTSGTSGFSGYSGADGQGTSGTSGYSGDSGSAGDSGVSGYSGLIGGGMTWVYKNAAYVAVDHEGILADTSVNPWTLTLPVAPAYGDSVGIIDQLGTFDANNLTVDGNGANIQGVFEPLICDIQNMNIELVYTGATDGWKVRTFPGYVSGVSGYSGPSGYSGHSGLSGPSGVSGPTGTVGLATFLIPLASEATATNFATLSFRNYRVMLDFDAATAESICWTRYMPGDYSGDGVIVTMVWTGKTADSGNVVWNVAFERLAENDLDVDGDSFATAKTVTGAALTSGKLTYSEITFANSEIDGVLADESFRLKVTRNTADGADTMAGDAQLLLVQIQDAG